MEELVDKVNKAEDGDLKSHTPSKKSSASKHTPKSRDDLTSASDRQHGLQFSNAQDKDFEPLRDVLGESFYEDEDSSEDEGMPDYKIGGYHPIHVGEILLDRYVII